MFNSLLSIIIFFITALPLILLGNYIIYKFLINMGIIKIYHSFFNLIFPIWGETFYTIKKEGLSYIKNPFLRYFSDFLLDLFLSFLYIFYVGLIIFLYYLILKYFGIINYF